MKAVILAAGYATRLYPLTKERPKPLLSIAQKPIIDYILLRLSEISKIRDALVVTNNKFFKNFSAWRKEAARWTRLRIKVINDGTKSEDDRRGAIGDIIFALKKDKTKEDILIVGGDNLFEDDFHDFMSFSYSKKSSVTVGLYDIKEKSLAAKYGVVKIDGSAKIVDFAEKPKAPESSLIATCLYYIPEEKLRLFDEYISLRNEKDAAGNFIRWVSRKEDVYSFVFKKRWYDIGDFSAYQEADRIFSNLSKKEKSHD